MRRRFGGTGRVCIVGAGNGGQAAACHLGLRGWQVSLYDVDREKIKALREAGGIRGRGMLDGTVRPRTVTTEIQEALEGAEFVFVTTTADSHYAVGRACGRHLSGGETFLIMPGYFGGALVLSRGLQDAGNRKDVVVCDAESLYYACRSGRPGSVLVTGLKRRLRVAAFPGRKGAEAVGRLRKLLPHIEPASNILETAWNNLNPVIHPPITLLNAGWIEKTSGAFAFYRDGCTRSVARVVEQVDRDRLELARTLGVRAESCRRVLARWYGHKEGTLYDTITRNRAYRLTAAPRSLDTRYISEDIPMGLIPYVSIGERYGIEMKAIRAIVSLACITMGTDYWKKARTVETMGLNEMGTKELTRFVQTGEGL